MHFAKNPFDHTVRVHRQKVTKYNISILACFKRKGNRNSQKIQKSKAESLPHKGMAHSIAKNPPCKTFSCGARERVKAKERVT